MVARYTSSFFRYSHFPCLLKNQTTRQSANTAADAERKSASQPRRRSVRHLHELRRSPPTWLLTVRDHDATEALFQTYKNDYSANWHYSRTLLAFRNGGEPGARRYLADAWEFNPHVPGLLIGAVEISLQLPEHYALGSPDEAVFYALDDRENWASTEGALPWLAEAIQTLPPPKKD